MPKSWNPADNDDMTEEQLHSKVEEVCAFLECRMGVTACTDRLPMGHHVNTSEVRKMSSWRVMLCAGFSAR